MKVKMSVKSCVESGEESVTRPVIEEARNDAQRKRREIRGYESVAAAA
jgi:hypothetical protein